MKKLLAAGVVAAALLFVSCTSVTPVCATSNTVGKKVGQSTGTYLFGVFPINGCDSSIKAAAENGGITKISTVDQKFTMGIFTNKLTTIVTGE